MIRPNLINTKRSIKISNLPIRYENVILDRYKKIKRNSFYLTLIGTIMIICIFYFLYQLYIEREITKISM